MKRSYLPNRVSISEACEWIKEQTGELWTLARLLEYGLMPWFWLDYQPGWPDALFGGRTEGYLAPICFAGDTQRLATDGCDVLVTMTRTHDGKLIKVGPPGLHFPIDELRFLRDDITRLAGDLSKPAAPVESATPAYEVGSDAEPADIPAGAKVGCTRRAILAADWPLPSNFKLENALSDVPKWLVTACVSRGAPGRGSSTWNPAQLAVCLVTRTLVSKSAVDRVIRRHFTDHIDEWVRSAEML
jgi:hypothetical protein